ncbi:biotin/lipoyl-containing protein [Noviherbaspirillum sedimenti]|uniref:Dihydrolipoamide acyltransferase n=1 Tax=Noviherbaspirillum sedimenti TaxID=2320865 RepID=A0A3A3G156_9BURK|nr:lipoyl domain-containing protein [Noviherbaspirillum sedimenti]RJG01365.1 dihydrolipoamide acyltransferase [Noviherbaspirillum sedimenti]
MTTQVLFPRIGFAMEEGTLAEWMCEDGAEVKEGQALYALESDKSVQEVESPASGTLRIIAKAGEVYKIGDVLGEIV